MFPECLRGGLRRRQGRVLFVLRVTTVLVVPLLVAAFSTQLVKALATVTLMGCKEVPQIQTAHRFTCQRGKPQGGENNVSLTIEEKFNRGQPHLVVAA